MDIQMDSGDEYFESVDADVSKCLSAIELNSMTQTQTEIGNKTANLGT